jgi:hypothetical protein
MGWTILNETLWRGNGIKTIEYHNERYKSVISPLTGETGWNSR